jgi:hypothetical protein
MVPDPSINRQKSSVSDPVPNPALFVSDLQDANYILFAYYFLKVNLHHSLQKEVTSQ